MPRNNLPLEVLGLLAPILNWVEGAKPRGLPAHWSFSRVGFQDGSSSRFGLKEREFSWLSQVQPTYSHDNLEEIVILARGRHRFRKDGYSLFGSNDFGPPANYDLGHALGRLFRRYFLWQGKTMAIRNNLMVELHELSFRFPTGHLLRFAQADAAARGILIGPEVYRDTAKAFKLHSVSKGLKVIVSRGLSEGHLHLNGVLGPSDVWGDRVTRRLDNKAFAAFSSENDRLLILARAAARLMALGVVWSRLCGRQERQKEFLLPFHLITIMDRIYHARGSEDARYARLGLQSSFTGALNSIQNVMDDQGVTLQSLGLAWMTPFLYPGMDHIPHIKQTRLPFAKQNIIQRRGRLFRLHFETYYSLIQSDPNPERLYRDPNYDPTRTHQHEVRTLTREFLHQVLFRYLVYHTHFWQMAIQRGTTTGLREFKTFFDSDQRKILRNRAYRQTVLRRLVQGKYTHGLEGRVSPPDRGVDSYRPWLGELAAAISNRKLQKAGLVVHFIKDECKDSFERPRRRKKSNANIEAGTGEADTIFEASARFLTPVRHQSARRKTRIDAIRLYRMLSRSDLVTPFILGIDAANLELTTPPEVFAPAFRFLREYPIEMKRGSLSFLEPKLHAWIADLNDGRRLNMTYHVGEDFRHILSGLRGIAETIIFMEPCPGDRLGHATALGIDPILWMEQSGWQAIMPKQELLDTMVWVHQFLGPGHPLAARLKFEDRIQRLAWEIYKPGRDRDGDRLESSKTNHPDGGFEKPREYRLREADLTPLVLMDSWRLRQLDPFLLDFSKVYVTARDSSPFKERFSADLARKRWRNVQYKVWRKVQPKIGSMAAYNLLERYWYSSGVRERGGQIICEDMQAEKDVWIELCNVVQRRMREIVGKHQLVIEANPSSNRLIGPMARFDQHPIFNLTLDKDGHLLHDLRVTVNTDNPGVFATSLAHEYYLLGEILLEKGIPEARVAEWLEWLRRNGEDCSFLRSLPDADDPSMKVILEKLCKPLEKKGLPFLPKEMWREPT